MTSLGDVLAQLVQRARLADVKARIVTADEAAEWADGILYALLRDGVLQQIEPTSSAACDACFEGHVEEVVFVEEPPGSPLRAYIACPEAGRVAVDTERMRRWQISTKTVESWLRAAGTKESEDHGDDSDGDFAPESVWPPTAAAFVSILRQAHRAGAPVLRWSQIKEQLGARRHFPHRTRDIKRNVPDWDEVVQSPRRGVYRLKI